MRTRRIFIVEGISLIGAALSLSACDHVVDAGSSDEKSGGAGGAGATGGNLVKVKVFNRKGELVGPIEEPKVVKSDAEWKKQLGEKTYQIARAKGTERAFCGNLLDNHKQGVYACVCCGLPLFASDSKFNSGTGWPSFFQPIAKENVAEHVDRSYGMERTESLCARCDCHLGHVFEDGPKPTGLRFCMNSESLKFTDVDKLASLADPAADRAANPGPTTRA